MKQYFKLMIVLLISVFIIGCGIKSTPHIIPPTPPKTESVIPFLKTMDKGISDSLNTNEKLADKLNEQKQIVSEQKTSIIEAISQAEKIKEKALANQQVSEQEAVNLLKQLHTVQSRNMFLEIQNADLTTIRNNQLAILNETKAKSTDTLQKLVAKENEADSLRTANGFLGDQVTSMNSDINKLQRNLENEKVKAARAEVYRRWIIGLASSFILWTIAKNIIMAYSPIKFRI